ncbi:16S rRNA (guanine(527)-N(7))-methyltransferase RsmG [Sphingomonas bacterium]|uniref:16S rRNA (guanine(527)-N(7))-methyltransferase RsmG n=1 Tax=Sphingomonas bacterium TaxID=1895847 RepID=UPI0015756ADC|nr:RsmG family class I SAM-dependent methyltransferase [Sphingomonas bacterium]
MTEDEARDWIAAQFGGAGVDRLDRFATLVAAENERQNLIAPSTVATIWSRHIVDSAQLIDGAPADGEWLDVGTGGGFPGLVVGLLRPAPMLLVEPRRRRAAFLADCIEALEVPHVGVRACRVELLREPVAVISARAVASVATLFADARHVATRDTLWLLPRGRDTMAQIAEAEQHWCGVFHVKQSVTAADSAILVATQVRAR